MQLRPYQQAAIDALFTYFSANSGNPIVALPTGTGKSVVIAQFIRQVFYHYPTQRVLMLTHVKELIAQNFDKLLRVWPTAPAGIYSAGLRRREHTYPITYAGIASVAKKPELFGHIDLVFIDECHLVSPRGTTQYQRFLDALRQANPALKVIGLTATPYRLGHGMLTDPGTLFDDICYDLTSRDAFNQLIAEGYLAPLVPKHTKTEMDLSSVAVRGGEFVAEQLQLAVDVDSVTQAALRETLEQAHDRKHWLVFTTGIEHTEHVTQALLHMGITACAVHSRIASRERDMRLQQFLDGEVQACVNANVLTTGFDFPELDCIVMLRPTSSPGLWVQMLGRGTRPAEGKTNCLVLDFAGNTLRLGPINDPTVPKRRGKGGKGRVPVKICDVCGTYNHTRAAECVECGHVFPKDTKLEEEASERELIAGGKPVVEWFDVRTVLYRKHTPRDGRPPSLLVTYQCGLRVFKEWVCLEHEAPYPAKKARDWWRERYFDEDDYIPTVDEALELSHDLSEPRRIRVWVNKKYPEILDYDFEPAEAR